MFFFTFNRLCQWAGVKNLGAAMKKHLDPDDQCEITAKTINAWYKKGWQANSELRPTTYRKFQALLDPHDIPEFPECKIWEKDLVGWKYILLIGNGNSANFSPGFKRATELFDEILVWTANIRAQPKHLWSDTFANKNPFFKRYLSSDVLDECQQHLYGKDFLQALRHTSITKAVTLTNLAMLLEVLAWLDAENVYATQENKPNSYYLPLMPIGSLNDYYANGVLLKRWVSVVGSTLMMATELLPSTNADAVPDHKRRTIDEWISGSEKPRWETIKPLLRVALKSKYPSLSVKETESYIQGLRYQWFIATTLTNMVKSLCSEFGISEKELLIVFNRYETYLAQAKAQMGC